MEEKQPPQQPAGQPENANQSQTGPLYQQPPYAQVPPGWVPPMPVREPLEEPEKIWGEEIKVGSRFASIVPRLLRSRESLFADIRDNKAGYREVAQMAVVSFVCFVLYGIIMGLYNPRFFPLQSIFGGIKLPLVFLGTLIVCILPFYIINIFVGLRLRFRQILNLFLTGVCSTSIVAVCLAPITAFFMLTIRSESRYHLMFLINVVLLGVSGFAGLVYISRAIRFLARHYESRTGVPLRGRGVLKLWMIVYIFVGIQLAWELRPYMVKEGTIEEGAALVFVRKEPYDFYSMVIHNIGQSLGLAKSDAELLEQRLARAEGTLEKANKKRDDLKADIAEIESTIKSLQKNIEDERARGTASPAELRSMENDLKQRELDLQDLRDSLGKTYYDMDEYRKEISAARKALDDYRRQVQHRGESD